ncbi:MAG: phage major capsid protein [Chthoniobacterales bacterium]
MNEMLKKAQEAANQALQAMKDVQAKSAGQSGSMPPDDQATFDNAYKAFQLAQADIERAQNLAKAENWANLAEDIVVQGRKDEVKGRPSLNKAFLTMVAAVAADGGVHKARENYDAALKALSVSSPPGGGYTVMPMELAQEVIRLVTDELYVRQNANVLPPLLTAESLGVVGINDFDDFSWTTERGAATEDTNEPFTRRELQPKRGSKQIKLSRTVMRLSSNAEQLVLDRIAFVMSRTQEKGFLTGTGAGQPLGFLVTDAQGVTSSRVRSSGTANVVGADDIFNLLADLKAAYRPGAFWMMHRNMEARLRKIKDSNNNYVWQPGFYNGNALVGASPNTLCGYPYVLTEFMTDPGVTGNITTGVKALALQNLKRGYWIVDALGMEIVPQPETYAASNDFGYVLNFMADGMPVDPNAFAQLQVS